MVRTRSLVWILLVALLISAFSPLAVPPTPATAAPLTPRGPIKIEGNGDFTSANGVTGGSGTPADPYVIEGWEIELPGTHGIDVQNTTAHFVIRDVEIEWASENDGVRFENVSNGRVEDSWIHSSSIGINIMDSTNISVARTNVSFNTDNVVVESSSNLTFVENYHMAGNKGVSLVSTWEVSIIDTQFYSVYNRVIDVEQSQNVTAQNYTIATNCWRGMDIRSSSNLTLSSGTISSCLNQGIRAESVDNLTVSGNTLTQTRPGIALFSSSSVTLHNNTIFLNEEDGVTVVDSQGVAIFYNEISLNEEAGVRLSSSLNVSMSGNNFTDDSLFIESSALEHYSSHSISPDNMVNGYPLLYYANCAQLEVDGVSAGQLIVANCTGLQATNLTILNADAAVQLAFVDAGNLTFNALESSRYGMHLLAVSNLSIANNSFAYNELGLLLDTATSVEVFHNDFINNTVQATDNGANAWDGGYPVGGNRWSDYVGVDRCSGPQQDVCPDQDQIGDTPYVIDSDSVDRYPLVLQPNNPPTADFFLTPAVINATAAFTANASLSHDVEDALEDLEVRWDWENNGIWDVDWTSEKEAQHVYTDAGTHTIVLEVRDTGWVPDTAIKDVLIGPNTPPTAVLDVRPIEGDLFTIFDFDASASFDPEDPDESLLVRWDWENDGAWDTFWTPLKTAQHRYLTTGDHTVKLEVMDSGSLTGSVATQVPVTGFRESTLLLRSHPGKPFKVAIPQGWDINWDFEFEEGDAADLYAEGPIEEGVLATITVASQRLLASETDDFLLQTAHDTITLLREDLRFSVKEEPRIMETNNSRAAVFIIEYDDSPILQVIGILASSGHRTLWVIIGTSLNVLVAYYQPMFEAVIRSFTILEAPPDFLGSVLGYVIIGAAAGAAAGVVGWLLYRRRVRKRRSPDGDTESVPPPTTPEDTGEVQKRG